MNCFFIYSDFGQITTHVEHKTNLLDGIDTNSILLNPLVNYTLELFQKEDFKIGEAAIVIQNGTEMKGILKALNNEYADIEIDNVLVRVKNYESVLQEFEKKKETSSIVLENPANLTYLFNTVGWSAMYSINMKDDIGSLSCTANISCLEKLSGDFTLKAGMNSYPLGYLDLENSHVAHLFSEGDLDVSKFYTYNVEKEKVFHGYSFTAPRFLPTGTIYFYIDTNYVGDFSMKETTKENTVELIVGETDSIKCISKVEEFMRDNHRNIKIISEITNHSERSIDLTIQYYVGNSTVLEIDHPITERVLGNLEWDLEIDYGQKYLFVVNITLNI